MFTADAHLRQALLDLDHCWPGIREHAEHPLLYHFLQPRFGNDRRRRSQFFVVFLHNLVAGLFWVGLLLAFRRLELQPLLWLALLVILVTPPLRRLALSTFRRLPGHSPEGIFRRSSPELLESLALIPMNFDTLLAVQIVVDAARVRRDFRRRQLFFYLLAAFALAWISDSLVPALILVSLLGGERAALHQPEQIARRSASRFLRSLALAEAQLLSRNGRRSLLPRFPDAIFSDAPVQLFAAFALLGVAFVLELSAFKLMAQEGWLLSAIPNALLLAFIFIGRPADPSFIARARELGARRHAAFLAATSAAG